MIRIDDNVPMETRKRGRSLQYPFDKMRDGQSFAVPVALGADPTKMLNSIRACANGYLKRNGIGGVRFTARLRDRDDDGAPIPVEVRVWAIAKD